MKRTLLLCVLAGALFLAAAVPASALAPANWPKPASLYSFGGHIELFDVKVQNVDTATVPQAPAFIEYATNAKATITVEILPSDSTGFPTDTAAVRTQTLDNVPKGHHTYLWPCILDDGVTMAPLGYYVARITATSTPTATDISRWDAPIGAYINWQYTGDPRWKSQAKDEWAYRNIDTAGATYIMMPRDSATAQQDTRAGFYGIGINRNPNSQYYGRIYAGHKEARDINMYDVDGTFLGAMNDAGVTWMESSPWDMVIADDDYVYVSDRTQMVIFCFKPDGSGLKSKSGSITNDRAIGGGWIDTAGATHLFMSSGTIVYEVSVASDHTTWSARSTAYNPDSAEAYGMFIDSTQTIVYQAAIAGNDVGVKKWTKSGSTWTKSTSWGAPKDTAGVLYVNRGCTDVDIESYDSTGAPATLWVARHHYGDAGSLSGANGDMLLVNATNGRVLARYDIAQYPYMICKDHVGNVLLGWGKDTTTWPSMYLGLFSTPGTFTKTAMTGAFRVPTDPAPVLVPGSESWVFGDPGLTNELVPDWTDTARLSFQVLDANGFSDIGDIKLDIKELRCTDNGDVTLLTLDSASVTQNISNPIIADCKYTLKAREGVQFGTRTIGMKAYDSDQPTMFTSGTFSVNVAGNEFDATVTHTRTGLPAGSTIPDALMKCVGGVPGVYGSPFTYWSIAGTDIYGATYTMVSQGSFLVTAEKLGFKTQAPKTTISPVVIPGGGGWPPGQQIAVPGNLKLGPLSIAEARALTNLAVYSSIEGLVYARPKGIAPTACTGQDDRLSSQTSATINTWGRMWYMCDPDNADGLQFQFRIPEGATFRQQWDDTAGKYPFPSTKSTYAGKRPAVGETICVTGWLETRPGYETRMWVDDANLAISPASEYQRYYYNTTDNGYAEIQALPTPNPVTVAGINHGTSVNYVANWGKYEKVENAIVVAWRPDGRNTWDGTSPAEAVAGYPVKYVVIADTVGNWATVSFQSTTTLGLPTNVCPVTVGDTYTFTGAGGKHSRFSGGTLRVRETSTDIEWKSACVDSAGSNTVGIVRGLSTGSVTFRGIVTGVFSGLGCIYVESADRSVGVRVTGDPAWVYVGDEVLVVGNVGIISGIKQVVPSKPIVVLNGGNAMPYLGMRLHDVGGKDYGASDLGITEGRGPLNIGLLVNVSGMVTYRDTALTFFYIWDGSNMLAPGDSDPKPLMDGTMRKISQDNEVPPNPVTPFDVPVLGLRIAHGGWLSAQSRGVKAWQDWIDIEGVVSVEQISGKTIPVIIPKTVTLRTAFNAIHSDAGAALYAGSNLTGVPSIPAATGNAKDYQYNPGDNPMPWEVQQVFSPLKDMSQVDGKIQRWETANVSQISFDMWSEPLGRFGGIILGDGNWVYPADTDGNPQAWAVDYSGDNRSIPQWIATVQPGWLMIAQPQNTSRDMGWYNDNGTETLTDDTWGGDAYMSDGANVRHLETVCPHPPAGYYTDPPTNSIPMYDWLQTSGSWWDNQTQSQYDIGVASDWPSTTTLTPWYGYFFLMKTADKAWIIL